MTRRIIAMGGGGFSMEPENPLLDDFILERARRRRPRICFLPTASGESAAYIVRFYRAFAARDCVATDLTFFGGPLPRQPAQSAALAGFIADQDIVYVGGGNVANALALWRAHGIDRALRTAWENGTVMCGLSAGMICWFAASLTDSFGALSRLDDGLGLLPFSACPHYDSESERRPRYQALVAAGLIGGYAAEDGAALCFEGAVLSEVVCSRPNAAAYFVDLRDGAVIEQKLPTRFLG